MLFLYHTQNQKVHELLVMHLKYVVCKNFKDTC